jgi:hypothetical protein
MPYQQQRREQPKLFLDASLVPLEKALMGRVDLLQSGGVPMFTELIRQQYRVAGLTDPNADILAGILIHILCTEYRQMAEELHYW